MECYTAMQTNDYINIADEFQTKSMQKQKGMCIMISLMCFPTTDRTNLQCLPQEELFIWEFWFAQKYILVKL